MIKSTRTRAVAALATMSLVFAACGGDDDDSAEPAAEEPAAEEPTEEPATEEPAAEEPAAEEPAAEESTEEPAAEEPAAEEPASGEPIKIGLLTSLTTNFAPWGLQVQDGMKLAVEEINAAGGVDGRPLELVEADDENDAEKGVAGFERLAEEGVIGIGGVISSTIGLATSPLAEELEVPTFLVKSGAAEILTQDSRYVFRTCLPAAPMVSEPIAQYAVANNITKVGAIIADYGWGQSIKAALEADFDALDGIELQSEVAPVPETDFTTYLRNLEGVRSRADRRHRTSTGVGTGHGPVRRPRHRGTDHRCVLAVGARVERRRRSGAQPILRLRLRRLPERGLSGPRPSLPGDVRPDVHGRRRGRRLRHRDDARRRRSGGRRRPRSGRRVSPRSDLRPAWLLVQMGWTEWGELATAQPLFSILGPGPAPEGVNEAGDWYPETLLLPEPLEPYVPE